jgi:hypothetical protein
VTLALAPAVPLPAGGKAGLATMLAVAAGAMAWRRRWLALAQA